MAGTASTDASASIPSDVALRLRRRNRFPIPMSNYAEPTPERDEPADIPAPVAQAIEQEQRARSFVRDELFPRLPAQPGAPESAGVYQAMPPQIEEKHRGV